MELAILGQEEFLCARCARHTRTCCQDSEIYVTPGDVERIRTASGREDFFEFRVPADPIYGLEHDDPLWLECVFREDGTRRVLKQRENGDCHFLGTAGCCLPLETRPLVCRLYPYDYTAAGLLEKLSRGCPIELLPAGKGLIEALAISRADAERWHLQLYTEIRQEKSPVQNL
ncbi:MAG: YkgJ family cysteine cluster protein [Planctomycetaceae bacterium]|nr:YkgJ family cysteine cluster protein [Planctomycetaceae bacterium]